MGGNYNIYQDTSKSSNRTDSICIGNTKTQKTITRANTGWERKKKGENEERRGRPRRKIIILVTKSKIQIWNQQAITLLN